MTSLHNGKKTNNRLTPKWTLGLEEAYGEVGKRARQAELMMHKEINSWANFKSEDFESNKEYQLLGRDISIKKINWNRDYYIDVKSNLRGGTFCVELNNKGWLFNPKKISDRICHVDVDEGWYVMYNRQDMKNYLIGRTKVRIIQKKTDTPDLAIFPMSVWKYSTLPFQFQSGRCK